ncbi:MAG TPA: hypothetical protein VMH28_04285 [Candidatus Acidoferrales bacterium]|nr:hypothetical protein [Candidatus Acidoferrales bacterium]
MRGASLFFITIMLVTRTGRDALEAYTSRTFAQFAAQSPYSDIAVAWMAILALVLLMSMRQNRREAKKAFVVVREVRGPVADPDTHRSGLRRKRSTNVKFRIRLLLAWMRGVARATAESLS